MNSKLVQIVNVASDWDCTFDYLMEVGIIRHHNNPFICTYYKRRMNLIKRKD